MKNQIQFRLAALPDYPSIADLHTRSWKTAYKNVLPESYLENIDGERLRHWETKMQEMKPGDFVLLAEDEDALLGCCSVFLNVDGFDAFVDNLHVTPEQKGKGIGSQLMCRAAQIIKRNAAKSLFLWVLDANLPAAGFYKKLGAETRDKKIIPVGGVLLPATRYVWENLDLLIERCGNFSSRQKESKE